MNPLQSLHAQQTHMHEDHAVPEGSSIGKVDFKVSCNESVQEDFNYALGLMHNMMYVSSREAFEKIIETDPECAMGYWGVATTLFQPFWLTRPTVEDLQRGQNTINKAIELVDSKREEHLINSTAEFFREPANSYRTRIDRWAGAMETAYGAHPDDLDIAALYSLSRLALARFTDDRSHLYDEAEEILRNIYEQVSTHPGAIHYTIHATDVKGRAGNAPDIVKSYGKIAPEVPHPLHMPTHIYIRLGNWPEVINWNLRSAAAALNYPAGTATSHHYLHAIDYLVYAYLQLGEDEKAEAAYREALTKDPHQGTFISTFHLAAIPARLAVEQRDWERAASLEPRTPEYLPWNSAHMAEGLTWFARGLGALHSGDIEAAQKAEQKLKGLRDSAIEQGEQSMAHSIEIDRLVLAGWIAHARGADEQAVDLIQSAADLEKSQEKHAVTPGSVQPPYEALGDLLMVLNRPAKALEAYQASDEIWPGRLNTLMGASLAAKMIGNDRMARTHFIQLLKNATSAESDLTASHER
ncbi:MAG: hypothetical protein U5K69_16865 [Balneolaceae bacterium]|nr:hypothetical protein [Balneolaceae bacterium]